MGSWTSDEGTEPEQAGTGEPFAQELERELADLVVIDGPRAGQVWTYLAEVGGFVCQRIHHEPAHREDADVVCRDAAAVIAHTGGNVRPANQPPRENR